MTSGGMDIGGEALGIDMGGAALEEGSLVDGERDDATDEVGRTLEGARVELADVLGRAVLHTIQIKSAGKPQWHRKN
jgi:hypothetical protein